MNHENNSNHSVNRNLIRKPDRKLLFVETGGSYSTYRIGNGGMMEIDDFKDYYDEVYLQFGDNRIGTDIFLRRWQSSPFDGSVKYIKEEQWENLYESMPKIDTVFICRKVANKDIQFEAMISMEDDGYFSPTGGKPYPVLYDANYPDNNILDDHWKAYEWKEKQK